MKNSLAIIFDMDGVMVDSNPWHRQAWKSFLSRHGHQLSEEELKHHVYGKINSEIIGRYFPDLSKEEIQEYAEEKERIFRELFKDNIAQVPGLLNFLKEIKENNITAAIATSAPWGNVEFVLEQLQIADYFSAIVDDSEVTKGKPDPEVYLLTAGKINYPPAKCIVFEDSISGINSAQAAGMKVIAITTSHSKEELSEADYVIDNFNQINLKIIHQIL